MSITIPLNLAKSLASIIGFTNKEVPNLARVYVEVLPNSITAVASDRYAIIESIYSERNGDGSLKFQITAEIAKFISGVKIANKTEPVELSLDGDTLTVSVAGQSSKFANSQLANGKELSAKLLEFAEQADNNKAEIAKPITLNLTLLSRAAKLLDYDGKKVEKWSFHLGQSDLDGKKPSPINAYAAGVITWHLVQQPMLDR